MIPYPQVLAALRADSAATMRRLFESMTLAEMVEVGTFIGPVRLRVVAARTGTAQPARPRGNAPDTSAILVETNRQAFNILSAGPARETAAPAIATAVRRALVDVGQRRRAGPLLDMPSDVTGFLPTPAGVPRALNDADYAAAATRLNVEVAAIKAVASVESSGNGFDGVGRPKILFEAHHFGPKSGNRFHRTHPHLSLPTELWRQSKNFYDWDQYQRLHEAMLLDRDAALMGASWGKFQVMGFNHSGWPDVRSFVTAMYVSEANHLRSFEAFCADNNLVRFIRSRDWLSFANRYNGSKQRGYDTRMATAYRANGGRN